MSLVPLGRSGVREEVSLGCIVSWTLDISWYNHAVKSWGAALVPSCSSQRRCLKTKTISCPSKESLPQLGTPSSLLSPSLSSPASGMIRKGDQGGRGEAPFQGLELAEPLLVQGSATHMPASFPA